MPPLKDQLLSGEIDDAFTASFGRLTTEERVDLFKLVKANDLKRGSKIIAELLTLLNNDDVILKIFNAMPYMDVFEILDSMRPSFVISLFNEWLNGKDPLKKRCANALIEEMSASRRASVYPLLNSLFECNRDGIPGIDRFALRVSGEDLSNYGARQAIIGNCGLKLDLLSPEP